ncbi:MAG: CoA pyrophosphatase [Planctomycetota bacterium]|nr:MAG: CoA pyrophosphatase [Planctomycetota bacterium]
MTMDEAVRIDVASHHRGLGRALRDPELLADRNNWRKRFSPELAYGRHFAPPGPDARPAAVLVILEPRSDGWSIPLTMRPNHLPDHPGQVSLPGGRIERGESPAQAALREAREEIGTILHSDALVGPLQPLFVFNSNYFVQPFLAIASGPLQFTACPFEVERVIHLPTRTLCDPDCHQVRDFRRGNICWRARTITCEEDTIWGATAVMLADLIPVLRRAKMDGSA